LFLISVAVVTAPDAITSCDERYEMSLPHPGATAPHVRHVLANEDVVALSLLVDAVWTQAPEIPTVFVDGTRATVEEGVTPGVRQSAASRVVVARRVFRLGELVSWQRTPFKDDGRCVASIEVAAFEATMSNTVRHLFELLLRHIAAMPVSQCQSRDDEKPRHKHHPDPD
jgi:hypothetical protein